MLSGYTDTYLRICGESWLPATDSECKAIEGGASPECCMEILGCDGAGNESRTGSGRPGTDDPVKVEKKHLCSIHFLNMVQEESRNK